MGPAARGLEFMSLVKLPARHCVVYCLHIVKSTRTALNYEEASVRGLDYVGSHQPGDILEEVHLGSVVYGLAGLPRFSVTVWLLVDGDRRSDSLPRLG